MRSVGGYTLDDQIGAGSAGTVWRAHRPGPMTRTVAVKRLRVGAAGAELDRLRREAAILTALDHPHVVRVLEVVDDEGGIAVVMQFAPGGSLDDLLAQRGRLPPGEVVAVAAPVAEALASAHRRGVLHGDVKPANVLFTSDGEPLLSDFGVARSFGRPVTADHGVAGTAEYLAPELLDGAEPGPRVDVYGLGVVCYEALTGRPPFTGPTPLAVIRAADQGGYQPLAGSEGVPSPLASAVERAMARHPGDRFATAEELARALRAALPAHEIRLPGTAEGTAAPLDTAGAVPGGTRTFGPRPPEPERRPTRRRRWPVAVGALIAVVAMAAALVVLADDTDDTDGPDGSGCASAPERQVVKGDTDGDGTPATGVYQQQDCVMVLEIAVDPAGPAARYQLGQAGDVMLLGDWAQSCDGVDTPALYRPSTGDIVYYGSWAQRGADVPASSTTSGTPGQRPDVVDTNGDGCDEVVLVAPA